MSGLEKHASAALRVACAVAAAGTILTAAFVGLTYATPSGEMPIPFAPGTLGRGGFALAGLIIGFILIAAPLLVVWAVLGAWRSKSASVLMLGASSAIVLEGLYLVLHLRVSASNWLMDPAPFVTDQAGPIPSAYSWVDRLSAGSHLLLGLGSALVVLSLASTFLPRRQAPTEQS